MRFITLILFIFSFHLNAQVFWTENFNNGCTTGCGAAGVNTGNGAWSVTNAVTVAEGVSANRWYVSCAENGMPPNNCGAGCGANASLHISAIGALCGPPDCGAAYNAGAGCTTSKRVESPSINSSGYSGITVGFNYIENGENTVDDASMYYSIDNGTTWNLQVNMAKTSCCSLLGGTVACSNLFAGQGYWRAFSTTLPATCDNITTLKIGFLWINNASAGKDPSIAIDDITLAYTTPLPITLSEFDIKQKQNNVHLDWSTLTEENFKGFMIQKSDDALGYYDLGFVKGHGNSNSRKNYSFIDKDPQENGKTYYYRLKMMDLDGSFQYSPVNTLSYYSVISNLAFTVNQSNNIEVISPDILPNSMGFILSSNGQVIRSFNLTEYYNAKNNSYEIPASDLAGGLYLLKIDDSKGSNCYKIIIP